MSAAFALTGRQNVIAESASMALNSDCLWHEAGSRYLRMVSLLPLVFDVDVFFECFFSNGLLHACAVYSGWSNRSCQTCSRRLMNSRLATTLRSRGRGRSTLRTARTCAGRPGQHDHAVAHQHRLVDGVGHEHHRGRPAVPDAQQFELSCSRVCASIALNGSSISSSFGSITSARAKPARCCMPPES